MQSRCTIRPLVLQVRTSCLSQQGKQTRALLHARLHEGSHALMYSVALGLFTNSQTRSVTCRNERHPSAVTACRRKGMRHPHRNPVVFPQSPPLFLHR